MKRVSFLTKMSTLPVYDPIIPFLGEISGGMRIGTTIKIAGEIVDKNERCQIDFQTGAALSPRDDVCLHLSVRPNEKVIVRNHFQNQSFGIEERSGKCKIKANQKFEIMVVAEEAQFTIYVNGGELCNFQHRMPMHQIRFLSLSGGCLIDRVDVE